MKTLLLIFLLTTVSLCAQSFEQIYEGNIKDNITTLSTKTSNFTDIDTIRLLIMPKILNTTDTMNVGIYLQVAYGDSWGSSILIDTLKYQGAGTISYTQTTKSGLAMTPDTLKGLWLASGTLPNSVTAAIKANNNWKWRISAIGRVMNNIKNIPASTGNKLILEKYLP